MESGLNKMDFENQILDFSCRYHTLGPGDHSFKILHFSVLAECPRVANPTWTKPQADNLTVTLKGTDRLKLHKSEMFLDGRIYYLSTCTYRQCRQCSSLHLDIYLYLACQILIGLWGNRFPPRTSARSAAVLRIHFRICAKNISSEKWTKCPIKFDGWQFVKFVKI